ncbi:MAG: hypothetical protein LBM94_03950 [Propionibacteriaceae bacterium]|jgi:hypothetical protein|nr:hypothetical protein [Propionibacteriaceae bacterium]
MSAIAVDVTQLDVAGLGVPPAQPIVALPPTAAQANVVRLSPATGEPKRIVLVGLVSVLCGLSSTAAAGALCWAWWQAIHMDAFPTAVRIIELFDPRPGSWQSILAVTLMAALGAAMVAAPWITAFVAWNGERWARIAGLIAVGISAGAWLMNVYAWAAVPTVVIAAALLWLPPVSEYFRQWAVFLAPKGPVAPDVARVAYGREDRYK